VRREPHAGCGGRIGETHQEQSWQGAPIPPDSKLKLLASRGWLAGVPGGLFTLPDHAGKAAKPGQ
jgi:hypothetical protein